jgi:hypothetical protein
VRRNVDPPKRVKSLRLVPTSKMTQVHRERACGASGPGAIRLNLRAERICGIGGSSASFRLDMRRADHFCPFLGFIGEQLAELGRCQRKRRAP